MPEIGGVTFSLDTPEAIAAGIHLFVLQGWCFAQGSTDDLSVFVTAGDVETSAVVSRKRGDVARFFKNASLEKCGFLLKFHCPPHIQSVNLFSRCRGVDTLLVEGVRIPGSSNTPLPVAALEASYQKWISKQEPELFWPENEIAGRLSTLDYRPLISIILPTYNTPPDFLQRCIESVTEQHYSDWELCIADDQSFEPDVVSTIEKYAEKDNRIKLKCCSQQGGISAASNQALENAAGDFVVLLDHDDELHPYALLELIRALNAEPGSKLLYSDEDKINEWGVRSQPSFKPDFDENIFLTFNYLGHMIALERKLANEIGGFRSECDGAQDWDLLIRATEVITPSSITHIHKPLYHWRMHGESTSMNLDAKPYVAKAWVKVLEDHAKRKAKRVQVREGMFYGSMRLKYPAPKHVDVGVFLRAEDGVFQSSVVQVNSRNRTVHQYKVAGCSVFEMAEKQAEYATAAAGLGYRNFESPLIYSLTQVKGDLMVFINGPLASINHLFFEELVSQGMRDDCGVVAGITLDANNRVLSTAFLRMKDDVMTDPYVGTEFGNHGYMGLMHTVRSVDACADSFFAVRRQRLADIGGLGAISSSDMHTLARKLCKNATDRGLSIIFTPYAVATFSEGAQSTRTHTVANKQPIESFRVNPQLQFLNI